ncbi:MAG TPA: hypothetical protein PKB04_10835 [Phenylobacterium sp.]|nr:hypothetical protein [Phenylobacterium sp.]
MHVTFELMRGPDPSVLVDTEAAGDGGVADVLWTLASCFDEGAPIDRKIARHLLDLVERLDQMDGRRDVPEPGIHDIQGGPPAAPLVIETSPEEIAKALAKALPLDREIARLLLALVARLDQLDGRRSGQEPWIHDN